MIKDYRFKQKLPVTDENGQPDVVYEYVEILDAGTLGNPEAEEEGLVGYCLEDGVSLNRRDLYFEDLNGRKYFQTGIRKIDDIYKFQFPTQLFAGRFADYAIERFGPYITLETESDVDGIWICIRFQKDPPGRQSPALFHLSKVHTQLCQSS